MGSKFIDAGLEEFQYSMPVAEDLYDVPRYLPRFRPRCNLAAKETAEALWECREDLEAAGFKDLKPGLLLGTPGYANGIAYLIPESIPERLPLIAYMTEFLTHFDDRLENATDTAQYHEETDSLKTFLEQCGGSRTDPASTNFAMEAMQARVILQLLEADACLGKRIIDQMAKFAGLQIGQRVWTTFEEYLAFRYRDSGADGLMAAILFCSDLKMSTAELEALREPLFLGWSSLNLFNDLISWEEEYDVYVRCGKAIPLINAVHLIMQENSLNEADAKEKVSSEVVRYEQLYCESKKRYIDSSAQCVRGKRCLGLFELALAGHAVQGIHSPRYNKSAPLPRRENGMRTKDISAESLPRRENGISTKDVSPGSILVKFTGVQEGSDEPTKSARSGESLQITAITAANPESQGYSPVSLSNEIILEPVKYIVSLPSKGVRDQLLNGLTNWYFVPASKFETISSITTTLNNLSLMLDDIEDGTTIRRGSSATHKVFGISQTVNSSNYLYVKCMEEVTGLSPVATKIFLDQMQRLLIGQSYDLHWMYHSKVPKIEEFNTHAEMKTGGLFLMASRMMHSEATRNQDLNVDRFMTVLGRYFQIWDDLNDLVDENVTNNPGNTCDLDQGNFTMPLIHAINEQAKVGSTEILSILQASKGSNNMSLEMKKMIVDRLKKLGSLEYTKKLLLDLHAELMAELEKLETQVGIKNWILRLLMYRLKL